MCPIGTSGTPVLSVKFKEAADVPTTAEIDLLVSLLPQLLEAMGSALSPNSADVIGVKDLPMDKRFTSVEDALSK